MKLKLIDVVLLIAALSLFVGSLFAQHATVLRVPPDQAEKLKAAYEAYARADSDYLNLRLKIERDVEKANPGATYVSKWNAQGEYVDYEFSADFTVMVPKNTTTPAMETLYYPQAYGHSTFTPFGGFPTLNLNETKAGVTVCDADNRQCCAWTEKEGKKQ